MVTAPAQEAKTTRLNANTHNKTPIFLNILFPPYFSFCKLSFDFKLTAPIPFFTSLLALFLAS